MMDHSGGRLRIPALVLGVIVLSAVGIAAWLLNGEKAFKADGKVHQQMDAPLTRQPSVTPSTPSPNTKPIKEVVLMPVAEIATSLNSPATDVQSDLSTLGIILREYRRQYQSNPTGENVEITSALMGDNVRSLGFIPKLGKNHINARGELIDRWGTPYFFHVLSHTAMEIRSAGQDGEIYTEDDAILSPVAGE